MRSRMFGGAALLVLVAGLAGCAPGPGGYADWAGYRQHQADVHAYRARRDADMARWQAQRGNGYGAAQAQAAANAEADRARAAHEHAQRDGWLSQF